MPPAPHPQLPTVNVSREDRAFVTANKPAIVNQSPYFTQSSCPPAVLSRDPVQDST